MTLFILNKALIVNSDNTGHIIATNLPNHGGGRSTNSIEVSNRTEVLPMAMTSLTGQGWPAHYEVNHAISNHEDNVATAVQPARELIIQSREVPEIEA